MTVQAATKVSLAMPSPQLAMRHVNLLDVTDDLNEPFGPSFERPMLGEANS